MCIAYVGCGHCWSIDGNWKLSFPVCKYPVKTVVSGIPHLNYPDVCVNQPVPHHAFCAEHCDAAAKEGIPTKLQDYISSEGIVSDFDHTCSGCTLPYIFGNSSDGKLAII